MPWPKRPRRSCGALNGTAGAAEESLVSAVGRIVRMDVLAGIGLTVDSLVKVFLVEVQEQPIDVDEAALALVHFLVADQVWAPVSVAPEAELSNVAEPAWAEASAASQADRPVRRVASAVRPAALSQAANPDGREDNGDRQRQHPIVPEGLVVTVSAASAGRLGQVLWISAKLACGAVALTKVLSQLRPATQA